MIKRVVIHCSATRPSQDWGAKEIDATHKERGFDRIGYNYVIRRNGRVEAGRAEGEELAHAKGFNKDSIAICIVGGLNEDGKPSPSYTTQQWRSLHIFVEWMQRRYPDAEIMGHRDLPNVAKACPSFDVRAWMLSGEIINPEG